MSAETHIWKPTVTVAAIIERNDRFLLVEEHTEEIRETRSRHRSPLVAHCVEDYIAGKRYPLSLLVHYSA